MISAETAAQNLIMKTTWLKLRWMATDIFFIHLFVDKDFEVLAEASPPLRAVVRVKSEITHFHDVVVQERQRNGGKKKCDALAEFLFCTLNLLLFWCSRYRRVVGSKISVMFPAKQEKVMSLDVLT